jgi:hypothetical protein
LTNASVRRGNGRRSGRRHIRNQRLTTDGAALCAEVSAKNKQGVYAGFRRAIVTDAGVSIEHDPDDNDRRPEHRFAAISKLTGCY